MARFDITHDPVTGTKLVGEIRQDGIYIHLDPPLKRMSVGDYKDLLVIFKHAKDLIKRMGFSTVNVLIPDDDKLIKFESMFGFEVIRFYKDRKGNRYVHMQQEV